MSNFPGQMLRQSPPENAWTIAQPTPVTSKVPVFAAAEDTGKFIKGILNNREKTMGKQILGATNYMTFQEIIDVFKKVYPEAGKTARYWEAPDDTWSDIMKGTGMPEVVVRELLENAKLLDSPGYYAGESLEWTHSVSVTL